MAQKTSPHDGKRASLLRQATRIAGICLALTGLGLLVDSENSQPPDALDDPAPAPVGYVVEVQLPITGNSDQSVRHQIDRILQTQQGEQQPVIVLKMAAGIKPASAVSLAARTNWPDF